MKKLVMIFVALIASCIPALAQAPIKQSGNVTSTHAWCITTNGIAQDCGTAAIPFLTTLGTVYNGDSFCAWSALSTAAGSQKICLGATTAGGADITVQNFGTAVAKSLTLNVNGIAYQFPFTLPGTGIIGPNSTTANDIAVWNNSTGTLLSDPATVSTLQNIQMGSGRPWCDVRAQGATATAGAANTDDTAAFTACQTVMPNGGMIYVPNGNYCLTSGFLITTAGIHLIGESRNSAILEACGTDVSPVSAAASGVELRELTIYGKGAPNDANESTFAATQPALLANSCSGCRIFDVTTYGGNHNIQSNSLLNLDYVVGGFAYGDLMLLSGGAFINDSSADENWPTTTPTAVSLASVSAYANNHAYTAGQIATSGGYYIQAMTSGTSAVASSPTLKNYTQTITDNTVTWQIVSKTGTVAWHFAGASTEYYSKFIDATGGVENGILIAAGADFKCFACLASQTINAPVAITGGALNQFTNLTTGYPILQQIGAIVTTSAFTGYLNVIGGQLEGDYGLNIGGGSFSLVGAKVLATTYDGVLLANGIIGYTITANNFTVGGKCITFGTGNNFGVFANNVCNGATNSGTPGTSTTVYGNDGSVIPVANGGTGVATLTGAVKGNGTSAFTQAACADLSNGGTACAVNTGTSGATVPLLNAVSLTWTGNQIIDGQIFSATGTPSIASGACGTTTNGAIVSGSTNQSGSITIGAAATTTCTISWSATLAQAPNACVFFPMNAAAAATGTTVARIGAPSTTQVVLTGSALANANYGYICL